MLAHFAVIAPPDELPYALRDAVYRGLLDRVGYYFPFVRRRRQLVGGASGSHAAEAM